MTATLPEAGRAGQAVRRVRLMPHTRLGRWAFWLALAAAVSPVCWGVLTALIRQSDPEAQLRTALVVAVAVPAVVVGAAALARRDARSIGLVVLSAVVVVEIAWVVVFVVSFGNALVGLCVVLGAVSAVLLGVLLARRISSTQG